jgi:ABC-type branched-subunit amino acid transport system substrate-binding protein
MSDRNSRQSKGRRDFIRLGMGAAAGLALPGFAREALAAEQHPPVGTWPAGASGNEVFIGIAVPRTGTYAVQGEDELKGWQLAVEHLNAGDPLIRKISTRTKKGVLGKEVKYGVADSAAKPNNAVQAEQRFITENHAILMTGSTSSAVAVAMNKLAQREKVLYVTGISGSNDTTGKDCVRYGFRQNFYGQTAAAALGPVLVKAYGKNKKAAYMTPGLHVRPHGDQVHAGLPRHRGMDDGHEPGLPAGAPDYSSYLLNIANSGADVLINVNWGHDAVLSIQQAQKFGILDKMKLAVPYQIPFLAPESGGNLLGGVYAATDFWWTLEDKYPLAKEFVEKFEKRWGYKPEWGANNAYMSFALWADAVEHAGTFYPPDVIKSFEAGRKLQSTVGEVYFRKEGPPARAARSSSSRARRQSEMKNKEDFWTCLEVVPGAPLMQKPDAFGCKLGDYA